MLKLQIDGSDLFLAGEVVLVEVDVASEDGIMGNFASVEGLGKYVTTTPKQGTDPVTGNSTLSILIDRSLNPGDATLDLTTDVRDFNVWNTNKFTSGTDWASGDFDGNGVTDVRDFNVWNTNKFTSASAAAPEAGGQVPEPTTWAMLAIGLAALALSRRRK